MHELLHTFDKTVANQIAKLPSWAVPFMTAFSFLGLPAVVVTASLLIAAACFYREAKQVSAAFALTVVALGANSLIKIAVQRTRPETLYVQSMAIKSYSFPSGHAFGSMVFYGLIAYLCYHHLNQPINIIVAIALSILILLIGLSRISLGAHFPSDVLVGWLAGGVALAIIIKVCKL